MELYVRIMSLLALTFRRSFLFLWGLVHIATLMFHCLPIGGCVIFYKTTYSRNKGQVLVGGRWTQGAKRVSTGLREISSITNNMDIFVSRGKQLSAQTSQFLELIAFGLLLYLNSP